MASTFRVVLGVDDSLKLTLSTGSPDSVKALKGEVKRHCGISGLRLQYRDTTFDNNYMNLTGTSDIKVKCTVKVIYITNESDTAKCSKGPLGIGDSSLSAASDTDIISFIKSASSDYSL